MLRFPNPGSNLENFIKIFENISFHLSKSTFNLDDMVSITVEHGLASSSGFIGKEAIKQSTRDDRSRDPLFNQMKMYSELYRHNGWLKSSPYRKLDYIVTPFGLLLSKSSDKIHKFILSNLCISFPNESIETKSKSYIRPFFTLFKIIKYIDYNISRDEIICSILSIKNDYGKENHDSLIEKIKKIRSEKNVELHIKRIMEEDKLSRNTLNNYTRYPVMFLRDSGLFDKKKSSFFLNKEGKKYLEIVENSYDLRLDKFKGSDKKSFNNLNSKIYQNLFNDKQPKSLQNEFSTAKKILLFNPFQQFDAKKLSNIFDWNIELPKFKPVSQNIDSIKNTEYETILKNKLSLIKNLNQNTFDKFFPLEDIQKLSNQMEINQYAASFCKKYQNSKQNTFYPIIQYLFNKLGLECVNSRYGVNPERWDSIIIDKKKIVPIEIKSPTEVLRINIKSIGQALENKIILHSRYLNHSDPNFTSLVVGYEHPNDRSEVSRLIIDIKKTYGFKIGVIDFFTLTYYVCLSLSKSKKVNTNQILKLNGLLEI